MSVEIEGMQMSSGISGLIDIGQVPNSLNVNGLVLPTGGGVSSSFNIPLVFPENDLFSIINIQILGASAGISNFWFPIIGHIGLLDFPNNYYVYAVVQSANNGRNIVLQFENNTVGSSVTVPNLTINVIAHMYKYPF